MLFTGSMCPKIWLWFIMVTLQGAWLCITIRIAVNACSSIAVAEVWCIVIHDTTMSDQTHDGISDQTHGSNTVIPHIAATIGARSYHV